MKVLDRIERSLLMEEMGKLIKVYRERTGLLQRDLGERTGMSQGVISSLEQGRKLPSIEQLYRMARHLNCEAWNFLPDKVFVLHDG